jgi:hypothetical protein
VWVKLEKRLSLFMLLLVKLTMLQLLQLLGSWTTAHVFGHGIHASTYSVKVIAYATHFDAIAVANERIW